ncbi:hypothetical protein Clacol_003481 [Clathrus columnatus]|uniref:Carbonic anhydrase n=1 Tax=Clathrus columnatus TaxID=1419009 RepID=A0AAV5A7N2_9AGAM|nr:hypothetical protein Clacol_003481 [Clathrus columnatus]
MPLGAKYAISRDRFLILNPLKQLSACKAYRYPSVPCTTFVHRARSTRMNPEQHSPIIARLLYSNAQWAADVTHSNPNFFPETVKGQEPKVLWIGCADSRVPESVITASKPGDIFTTRNIANQFPIGDISAESVLQYAVNNLGVDHIIVAGHTNCGGAAAALATARKGEPIPNASSLEKWLSPLIKRVIAMDISPDVSDSEALLAVVKENVKMQIENICETDTIRHAKRKLLVHGWVYGLGDGRITDLHLTRVIEGTA